MTRSRLIVLICLFVLVSLIAACGGESKESNSGDVVITLWNSNDSGRTYYPEIIEKFEAEHEGIKVELKNLSQETVEAEMQAALSDNSLPDLFNQDPIRMDQLVELDAIRPIDELFPEEERAKYDEGIFDEGNASLYGNIYLFPKYKGNVYMMYYNKELLEEYGIDYLPETWDEFREIGNTIYDQSGGSSYGLILGGQSDWLLNSLVKAMATELSPESHYNFWEGNYKFQAEGYTESIKLLKEFYEEDLLSPTSLEVINEVALEFFANGEAAFLVDGNWTGALLDAYGFNDWGVIPIPTFHKDGQQYQELAIGSNDGLYVSKNTKHWEEVKIFLEFLKDHVYVANLELGEPAVAMSIENFDIELPFEQMADISDLFSINIPVPDPLVVNSNAQEVMLELRKNLPETSIAAILMGYLTNQIDDLEGTLQKYEDDYNAAFDSALESSDDVTREDFMFPNWTPYEPYTEKEYQELD